MGSLTLAAVANYLSTTTWLIACENQLQIILQVADYTAGRELHPTPKNFFFDSFD